MIEKIVACLKFYKCILEFYHWNTRSYSYHILYERLKNEIDDITDRLVEVYLACENSIDFELYKNEYSKITSEWSGFEHDDIAGIILFSLNTLNSLKYSDENKYIARDNVIADIHEMFSRHLYLVKKNGQVI